MRPDQWVTAAVVLLTACGPARLLTRPEGNGGWSPERRQEELSARAAAAGVDLGPSGAAAEPSATGPPARPPGGPLDLPTALALAVGGLIIASVGVTTVFVPQDLQYIGLAAEQL